MDSEDGFRSTDAVLAKSLSLCNLRHITSLYEIDGVQGQHDVLMLAHVLR